MNVAVVKTPFADPSADRSALAGSAQQKPSGTAADCSCALSSDYACYQERYRAAVRDSDVKAASAELKDGCEANGS